MALQTEDTLLGKLIRERQAAFEYRERRHEEWNENYILYRNRPKTNRLTQRQAVFIPLLKETVRTLHSKIDDPPNVEWKELAGDDQKQALVQEIWNDDYRAGNYEGVDAADKKSVLLYGRGVKKLDWKDGRVKISSLDIYDIYIDPYVNPFDLETARFIIHTNIFRPLREILSNPNYSEEAKNQLKEFKYSDYGLKQQGETEKAFKERVERLKATGVSDDDFAVFTAGDVIVNVTEHFSTVWDEKAQKYVRKVFTYADEKFLLRERTLKEALGVEFWPFVSWGDDMESDDFWSDSAADLVRTPNKIVNVWFSQLVENRTLRNFGMFWYDSTNDAYQPQTFEPGPGRMLPAPGSPRDTIMPVDISGLDDTLGAIDFVTKIVERGTAATAIEKGTSERNQITLGEVEMLVGKAMERTVATAKYYRRSWEELAMKWMGIREANAGNKSMELYKLGANGKIYPKTVFPGDWKSQAGYRAMVLSSSEQDESKSRTLQRVNYLLQTYPTNRPLKRIALKRILDIVDFTPEEIREISEEEKDNIEKGMAMPQEQMQGGQSQMPGPNPEPQQMSRL